MMAIGRSGSPSEDQKAGPYPPVPIPSTNRPWERWPTVAAWMARANGVHIRAAGTTEIPDQSDYPPPTRRKCERHPVRRLRASKSSRSRARLLPVRPGATRRNQSRARRPVLHPLAFAQYGGRLVDGRVEPRPWRAAPTDRPGPFVGVGHARRRRSPSSSRANSGSAGSSVRRPDLRIAAPESGCAGSRGPRDRPRCRRRAQNASWRTLVVVAVDPAVTHARAAPARSGRSGFGGWQRSCPFAKWELRQLE